MNRENKKNTEVKTREDIKMEKINEKYEKQEYRQMVNDVNKR